MDAAAEGDPRPDTVASGFPSLDRMLGGGFRCGDLVVVAGDVGSGKSALGLGMALRASRLGAPTVFLSGEMSEDRLTERALALEGRLTVDELRLGRLGDSARAGLGAAAHRLKDLPLRILPLLGAGFAEVEGALDVLPRPRLLLVDSLQLVAPPDGRLTLEESVAQTTRWLKALALDRGVVVLALSHLLPGGRAREDRRPTLDDLGGLGAVKQHADVVLAIYREEMYAPGNGVEGATELIVGKNRNGQTGFVDLYFYRRWLRFEDMLDPEP